MNIRRICQYLLSLLGVHVMLEEDAPPRLPYDTTPLSGIIPPNNRIPKRPKATIPLSRGTLHKWREAIDIEKNKKKALEVEALKVQDRMLDRIFKESLENLETRIKETISEGRERVAFLDPLLFGGFASGRYSQSLLSLRNYIQEQVAAEIPSVDKDVITTETITAYLQKQLDHIGMIGFKDTNGVLYVLLSDIQAICDDEPEPEGESLTPYRG